MSTERRIKSLKCEGGRVEIAAIETWGISNEREWTQRCSEDPDPAMPAAIAKLPPLVRDLLELPRDWAEGNFRVLKVTWSYSENTGVQGAVMTCRADLECATSPLILNTPHLPFEQYNEGGEAPTMPDEIIDLLEEIEGHAMAYLNGTRAQQDLFSRPAGKDAAAGERPDTGSEAVTEPARDRVDQAVDQLVAIVDDVIKDQIEADLLAIHASNVVDLPISGNVREAAAKRIAAQKADKYIREQEKTQKSKTIETEPAE